MKKSFFRIIVVVFLVCALLVSWSPIRVQASALPEVAEVVTKVIPFAKVVEPAALGVGGTVFCWVAAGLGLVLSTKQAVELYNAYQDFTGDLETSIYYYPDGSWSYGVDVGFVDRVRAFLFDSGYLADTGNLATIVPEGEVFRDYTANAPCVAFMYSYSYYVASRNDYYFSKSGYLVCTVPDLQLSVNGKSYDGYITYNDSKHYYYMIYQSATSCYAYELSDILSKPSDFYYVGDTGTTYTLREVIEKYGWSGVQGVGDTVIDYVAPPDVSIDVGYPDWYTNARPAVQPDTDEEITILPIPLNPSANPETQIGTLTQPDIWQGALADPMPDTDTNPDTGTDTDPDTQPDSPGAPSTDIGKFQIDLKDFFPFCIPFDLYRFIEILCAEPEAPVFHWEFNVFGELHSLDVDLSPWNSHAQLFRDAQVGLFIMGLLWITRKFIKW